MIIKDITRMNNASLDKSSLYMVSVSQKEARKKLNAKRAFVLIPDFLKYTRLISSQEYSECLKLFISNMKIGSNLMLNAKSVGSLIPMKGVFWPAVIEMSLVDLSSINNENIVISPYLIDMALQSGKFSLIKKIVKLARSKTNGKIGIWTRNANLLFLNSLKDLQIDFLIMPINSWGAGMRMDINDIMEKLAGIEIISDYSTHFANHPSSALSGSKGKSALI